MTDQSCPLSLDEIALHEAGHAVAQIRLFPSVYIEEMTVIPDPEIDAMGRIAFPEVVFTAADDEERYEGYLKRYAVVACAGYAALRAAGRSHELSSWGTDYDYEAAGRYLDHGKAEAIKLMSAPENIAAVQRVAAELTARREISGELASVLVDLSDGEISEAEYADYLAFQQLLPDQAG